MKATIDMTDIEEIRNLFGRYCRAIDDRDLDEYARILAEHVRFEIGPAVIEGRENVLAYTRSNIWPAGRHLTFNPTIRITGQTAHGESDWLWLDPELNIAHAGRYSDEFCKEDNRWCFSVRRVMFFEVKSVSGSEQTPMDVSAIL